MRLAFLGTPQFAVPSLAALIEAGHEIAAVYSRPPKPRGRGQALQPSPVHAFAEARGVEVRTPASMKDAAEVDAFRALDLDAAIVVAFGQILTREVLAAPRLGCFNLHASLLPRWRGAAPIQRAIMAGDHITGVQVMRMTEGLDEGPIIEGQQVRIDALDTAATLQERLADVGARLLPEALAGFANGTMAETPQPWWSPSARSSSARCWRRPGSAASTCTPRCCRAGAGPRRSSGRSWPATTSPASRSCA